MVEWWLNLHQLWLKIRRWFDVGRNERFQHRNNVGLQRLFNISAWSYFNVDSTSFCYLGYQKHTQKSTQKSMHSHTHAHTHACLNHSKIWLVGQTNQPFQVPQMAQGITWSNANVPSLKIHPSLHSVWSHSSNDPGLFMDPSAKYWASQWSTVPSKRKMKNLGISFKFSAYIK